MKIVYIEKSNWAKITNFHTVPPSIPFRGWQQVGKLESLGYTRDTVGNHYEGVDDELPRQEIYSQPIHSFQIPNTSNAR